MAYHFPGCHVPGEDDEARLPLPDVHSLAPDPVIAGVVDQADGGLVGDRTYRILGLDSLATAQLGQTGS